MLDLLREEDTAEAIVPKLAARGFNVSVWLRRRIRAVTHLDVSGQDIDRAIGIVADVPQ